MEATRPFLVGERNWKANQKQQVFVRLVHGQFEDEIVTEVVNLQL